MKKNITINLFGTLYNIDDDAYQLLERYLNSMKDYFKRQSDGAEIADDIEHRVAELLWEKKQQGIEAVNIDLIKEIVGKIGNPDEIDDEENKPSEDIRNENVEDEDPLFSEEEEDADGKGERMNQFFREAGDATSAFAKKVRTHVHEHRLYRDGNDKVLGGVLSGLSQYFGKGDPVLWRLGLVLLFFILWYCTSFSFFFLPTIYLILWLVVPEAITPEDKLLMKGEQVTPENLKEQIMQETETERKGYPTRRNNSGCMFMLVFGIILAALPVLAIVIVFLYVSCRFLGNIPIVSGNHPDVSIGTFHFNDMLNMLADGRPWIMGLGTVVILVLIALTVYGVARLVQHKPLSPALLVILIVMWAITLILGTFIIAVSLG